MKTRLLIVIIAATALISFGASRIHKESAQSHVAEASNGTIGGFAAEDK